MNTTHRHLFGHLKDFSIGSLNLVFQRSAQRLRACMKTTHTEVLVECTQVAWHPFPAMYVSRTNHNICRTLPYLLWRFCSVLEAHQNQSHCHKETTCDASDVILRNNIGENTRSEVVFHAPYEAKFSRKAWGFFLCCDPLRCRFGVYVRLVARIWAVRVCETESEMANMCFTLHASCLVSLFSTVVAKKMDALIELNRDAFWVYKGLPNFVWISENRVGFKNRQIHAAGDSSPDACTEYMSTHGQTISNVRFEHEKFPPRKIWYEVLVRTSTRVHPILLSLVIFMLNFIAAIQSIGSQTGSLFEVCRRSRQSSTCWLRQRKAELDVPSLRIATENAKPWLFHTHL